MWFEEGFDVPSSDSNRMVGFGTGGIKPSASTAQHLFVLIWTTFVFYKVSNDLILPQEPTSYCNSIFLSKEYRNLDLLNSCLSARNEMTDFYDVVFAYHAMRMKLTVIIYNYLH
jgi:hypothetical protein